MTAISPDELSTNVRAQADFRLKFGIPVALVMLVIMYYVSPDIITQYHAVEVAMGVYVTYTLAVRYFAAETNRRYAPALVYVTAVSDPLFLSAWLYIFGDPAILFVGMYVFTVLGFGFRLGNRAMFVCQSLSIAGFVAVMLTSSRWRQPGLAEISHLVVMIMVPLYASSLISRLQSAKELAQYESKAKSMLLAKVSHELRTPLTGIVSSAQLIEVETTDPAIASRAQAIHEMASGLDVEIERMLDLARLESKGARSESSAFQVSHVTDHVMRVLGPVASIKGLELHLDMDPRITQPVMGGAQDLLGVLMNLVGNAIKFTPAGSVTIRVDLVADKGSAYRLQFGVKDTGIGIPAEHLPRIFEPFYQVESGANRKFGGTGLGTSIAMEYVKRMGGLLQVQSQPGDGTLFWFELELPHAVKVKAEAVRAAPRVVTGKRVLIADDNRVNLELLRQMLLKDQHNVTTATSGGQALQLLAREDFDLVFLDFNMGDIDGATVYQTYCFGRIQTAPTYFITADATRSTAARLAETGASGVIYKPLSFDSLRKAIASQFPDEIVDGQAPLSSGALAAPSASAAPAGPAKPSPRLRVVPVAFIDPEAIDHLREIKDTPEFMFSMISEGLEDIESTHARLTESLRQHRLPDVHHDAHTLRGLSLSFGAVRLAAIADRLMTVSDQVLAADRAQFLSELHQTYAQSVSALRDIRRPYAPSEEAGRES